MCSICVIFTHTPIYLTIYIYLCYSTRFLVVVHLQIARKEPVGENGALCGNLECLTKARRCGASAKLPWRIGTCWIGVDSRSRRLWGNHLSEKVSRRACALAILVPKISDTRWTSRFSICANVPSSLQWPTTAWGPARFGHDKQAHQVMVYAFVCALLSLLKTTRKREAF